MKKFNGQIIYSPSDLIKFMESDFITWMDRYHAEFPNQLKKDDPDEFQKILQRSGQSHEDSFLNKLKKQDKVLTEITDTQIPSKSSSNKTNIIIKNLPFIQPIVTKIKKIYLKVFGSKNSSREDTDSYTTTKRALEAGDDIIYQAHLRNNNEAGDIVFEGKADFLFKVKGDSKLGNWHYEPWDTKLALTTKPYFIIQLCCYAEMLESIQGIRPKYLHVVLGNNEKKSFRTDDYFYFYEQVKNSFLQLQKHFNPKQQPELNGLEDYNCWTSHAKEILNKQDHLGLVANISKTQIKKLKKNGITTLTQLAQTPTTHIPEMLPTTLVTLKKQAAIQLLSRGKTIPEYEIIPPIDDDPRRGLALLPPASTSDIWFDIEGSPDADGGLEYLLGVICLDNTQKTTFKDWWAHNPQQEKIAFQAFVNWVYTRWQNDPTMHIYHYSPYEPTALKRLMGRYGICEEEIDNLLRNEVFVDLYKIAHQGIRAGTPNYSLKSIELLYKDCARTTQVAKATDSIVYYKRWLDKPDGHDYTTSELLKSIRDYNRDDCISTKHLCDWLRNLQIQSTINYVAKPKNIEESSELKASDEGKKIKVLAHNLAQTLLASLETNSSLTEEQKTLTTILAHLLEFHNREERPVWWAMFNRHEMTEEQLIEDLGSLGALKRTNSAIQKIKQSYLYEYSFAPIQDTKIKTGDRCYYAHNLKTTVEIASINTKDGVIQIKLGSTNPMPPQQLNLIPCEHVPTKNLQKAICTLVKEWHDNGKLPQAIEDLLLKRKPRFINNLANPIISGIKPIREETIDAIKNMNNTTLCIQGPPGSGKTHTAAHAITELIRDGKTVGITSNSHKAIANLIDKVMVAAEKQSINFNAVKIQSSPEDFYINSKKVAMAKTADVFPNSLFKLIGGTAWTFSHPLAKEQLDYLFVDEAGQVSIANLVGMAASTKNIVLMGDQMQLSQPIKGSHPGESGKSCLDYLLEEYQTIPKDRGIFLDTTFRLHPEICKFISNAIYEGHLQPQANTDQRQIILPQKNNNLITKKSGLLFVPVAHEENNQNSDEEVVKIQELINELLKCNFQDNTTGPHNAPRPLTMDDILIIAPYNMQVDKIKDKIPQANVGTIDKFQGQEAPVTIISMCASNANDSARGLEFLFSKNRLNVAISRAQVLAIVVGNPGLANTSCSTVEQMELTNLFCRIVAEGSSQNR